MLVAVIADTHLPRGSRRLPARCSELIASSDALIHAGDITAGAELEALRALGPPVHAVHGNVDEPVLQESLPAELRLDFMGHEIGVIHDPGAVMGASSDFADASRTRSRDLRAYPLAGAPSGRRIPDLQPGEPDRAPPLAHAGDGAVAGMPRQRPLRSRRALSGLAAVISA